MPIEQEPLMIGDLLQGIVPLFGETLLHGEVRSNQLSQGAVQKLN